MTQGVPSIAAVGEATLLKARENITGCYACDESASRLFQSVLAQALEDGGMIEYVVGLPIACPRCASPILETTMVTVVEERRTNPRTRDVAPPDEENVMFVDEATLFEAERYISGCENCVPDAAQITFEYVLDAITCCDPTITDYVMCQPARCQRCKHEVMPKTCIIAR
jgi:hypothetical protein